MNDDTPAAIKSGGVVRIRGDVSSQFLTALLMALPLTGETVTIEVEGELISKPYIEITLNLMARFGVEVERHGWSEARQSYVIHPGSDRLDASILLAPIYGGSSAAAQRIAPHSARISSKSAGVASCCRSTSALTLRSYPRAGAVRVSLSSFAPTC